MPAWQGIDPVSVSGRPDCCPGRLSYGGAEGTRSEFVLIPGVRPATLSEARISTTLAARKQRGTVIINRSFLASLLGLGRSQTIAPLLSVATGHGAWGSLCG